MKRAKTMGWLRARVAEMADVPDDTPVFVMAEGDEGSITEGLGAVEFHGESKRAPSGVWLPRVYVDGCGYAGSMELWREGDAS